jgi:hypothetical protein
MEIKKTFWQHCKIRIGDGSKTSFWEDQWIGSSCLSKAFPRLFLVSMNRNVKVKEVFDVGIEMLRFRRAMVGELREQCLNLKKLLERVTPNKEPDKLIWKLTTTAEFSVKSMYLAMQCNDVVPYKFLWKIKIPLRVKTFLWLVIKGSILTRDVLLQRGGKCEKKCLFCGCNETVSHLFFKCSLARYIWNVVSCTFGMNFQFETAKKCISTWLLFRG